MITLLHKEEGTAWRPWKCFLWPNKMTSYEVRPGTAGVLVVMSELRKEGIDGVSMQQMLSSARIATVAIYKMMEVDHERRGSQGPSR